MSALENSRNLSINIDTTATTGMPVDAYKVLVARVEKLEAEYQKDPSAFSDILTGDAVPVLISGLIPYRLHVFDFYVNYAAGTYNFDYIETVPNPESVT